MWWGRARGASGGPHSRGERACSFKVGAARPGRTPDGWASRLSERRRSHRAALETHAAPTHSLCFTAASDYTQGQ